jgi:Tfp pilus tip-associated adhesin PilY1
MTTDSRNIYTALPNGQMVPFTAAMAALLQPYLRAADVAAAERLIQFVRSQPLGAIIGSTPAMMDPPSLDPPPDAEYPGFAAAHQHRRSIIWVGMNDGMLHAIDARLGKEVWAFIPFNLLPKLVALQGGQPVGDFRFFMDGSPKVADVKVDGEWRTYLVVGQGPGGTFYQTFDVTLEGIADAAGPDSDALANVLAYFAQPASVTLEWAFPRYDQFDVNAGQAGTFTEWGDIASSASSVFKTVGETWSDPAVGQLESAAGPYVVLTGSGFFRASVQKQAQRGVNAGTTFYMLDVADGTVLDSRDVGHDNKGETVDNCAAANNCRQLKNALQADPVATGPTDTRFITKAYIGDLDGRIWRFDLGLDAASQPKIKQQINLYTVDNTVGPANEHPLFSSMATVNVGTTQQYLFAGTGSDLLPQNGVNGSYALLVVLDQGTTGTRQALIKLEATDGLGGDEKVSAFPAVAGDIVFFSTTTYRAGGCAVPDANLYAFTFIGGPAYDTSGDGTVCTGAKCKTQDSPKVMTVAGSRATAPFIVDQHLVFGTGGSIEMFGDPNDFNNGVGQAGVRILSWREVR